VTKVACPEDTLNCCYEYLAGKLRSREVAALDELDDLKATEGK
jgi:hypothetical protein